MDPPPTDSGPPREPFQPLEVMGIFWLGFGLIVLLATVFVEENEYVPLARGIFANLAAAAILLGVGGFSFWKGRQARRKGGA